MADKKGQQGPDPLLISQTDKGGGSGGGGDGDFWAAIADLNETCKKLDRKIDNYADATSLQHSLDRGVGYLSDIATKLEPLGDMGGFVIKRESPDEPAATAFEIMRKAVQIPALTLPSIRVDTASIPFIGTPMLEPQQPDPKQEGNRYD